MRFGAPGAIEEELASFAAGLRWDAVPDAIGSRVLLLLTDALANGIAGRAAEGTARLEDALLRIDGSGDTVVFGTDRRGAPLLAAAMNAYQITAFTMCDVYRPALCHVTPEVVPAVFAAAQGSGADGRSVLAALTVGLELTARLGRGLGYASFRRRGFHAPGVIGAVGAALAAARVLGLDADGAGGALALGAAQAAGTFAALGSEEVKLHQVNGSRSGLMAALLAAGGVRGAQAALTSADGGLLHAYSDGGMPDRIVSGLGHEWELERISLRPRPGSSSVQSVGECASELATALEGRALRGVRAVRVVVPESAYVMCGATSWDEELSALQSARYLVGALLYGWPWWVELFDVEHRSNEQVGVFAREQIDVVADPGMPVGAAAVSAELDDGRRLEIERTCALGDPDRPVGEADVREKLERATRSVRTVAGADAVATAVKGLADSPFDLPAMLAAPAGCER